MLTLSEFITLIEIAPINLWVKYSVAAKEYDTEKQKFKRHGPKQEISGLECQRKVLQDPTGKRLNMKAVTIVGRKILEINVE